MSGKYAHSKPPKSEDNVMKVKNTRALAEDENEACSEKENAPIAAPKERRTRPRTSVKLAHEFHSIAPLCCLCILCLCHQQPAGVRDNH